MRFLLRMTFWLGVIVVLLPRSESPASNAQISATDAVSAATATVGDVRQFCERQPEACTVGSQAAVALEDRAKAGRQAALRMFNERLSANATDKMATSAVNAKPVPLPTARPSHATSRNASRSTQAASPSTLTPADLVPAWRDPAPRKDPHEGPA